MADDYRITQSEKPDDSMWSFIGGGLHQYNVRHGGDPQGGQICFILYSPENEIAGGLIGETHWSWFYINLLFVKEELRGRGYGHQLLTLAETEARKLGAKHAYLDTFTFQAPGFYERHGYHAFGTLDGFPPGHKRIYYTKQL